MEFEKRPHLYIPRHDFAYIGYRFTCTSCNLHKYVLGKDAKKEIFPTRCLNCKSTKLRKESMPAKEAIALSNIKARHYEMEEDASKFKNING